jgi:hypothetical protein
MFSAATLGLRGVFYLGKYSLRHQENLKPILRSYRCFNSKVRVSASAIVNIEREGLHLLVRNHHRPEQYAPFGGVYKHADPAPEILTKIEWESDYTTQEPKLEDMKCDLRGVIYGKHFPTFLDWFTQRHGREGEQSLYRELREELLEGKVGKAWRNRISDIKVNLDRRILEGPYQVEGRDYCAQFRYFEVFKPQCSHKETREIFDELFRRAAKGDNSMKLVTKDEIMSLRVKETGEQIGPHSKYYYSSQWHGVEPPKY